MDMPIQEPEVCFEGIYYIDVSISDGDLLTIIATSVRAEYYINNNMIGAIVAKSDEPYSVIFPTVPMHFGAAIHVKPLVWYAPAIAPPETEQKIYTAQGQLPLTGSVDMMSIKA